MNGATSDMQRLAGTPNLGALATPSGKHSIARVVGWGMPWGVDNDALSGFEPDAFCGRLDSASGLPGCLWVAAPDSVAWVNGTPMGDAGETLKLFERWAPVIRGRGFPVAFVSQDGSDRLPVPWGEMDAMFVGGSDDWKTNPRLVELCREAKRRGKKVHYGRVNSYIRIRAALAVVQGEDGRNDTTDDSFDGSQFSWWPRRYIPKGLRWIREAEAELAGWRRQATFSGAVGVTERALSLGRARGGGKRRKESRIRKAVASGELFAA